MNKEAKVHRVENITNEGSAWGELLTTTFGTPQHLYITTDEDAKEGEYCIDIVPHGNLVVNIAYQKDKRPYKQLKIIATTDPKLTIERYITGIDPIGEDSTAITRKVPFKLPQIPQSFIEEYCKAGGIDKILVEYEVITNTYDNMVDLMCPHSVAEYEQTTSSTLKLKTDSNNCIIIHPVEEKMYSREEMLALCKEAFSHGVRLWEEWEEEDHEMWDKFVKENL